MSSATVAEATATATATAAERGRLIGRYIVISQLGAGAMGVVFAAFDPELDRKVALKLLKHRGGDVVSARKRLQREAQSLAKLDHPNVVRVFDVGVHAGQLFVAMEFVEGQTLGDWLAGVEQPRPWPQVLEVFMAAGRGLAAAHETGLIHRDFKPDNVMLGVDGRVRVMDFGLARGHEAADSEPSDAIGQSHAPVGKLTQTGAMMGTPAYMSFEQFEATDVDARSDQFGFCVALYEALYGQRPFAGETLADLLRTLEGERIRPAPQGAKVPGWLRDVVVRGLAKDPGARFASMQALLGALAADPIAKRRRWATRAGLAIALAGSVIGLSFLGLRVVEQRRQIVEEQATLQRTNAQLREREQQLEAELDIQKGMSASMLAESAGNELAALRLAITAARSFDASSTSLPAPVFTGLARALTGVEAGVALLGHAAQVVAVAYSPDGQWIASASFDRTVRLWSASSGALEQTLAGHQAPVHALAFCADGSRIATASGDQTVRIWDVASGKQLTKLEHSTELFGVAFSPDAARVATAGADGRVRIWSVADARELWAVSHEGPVRAVAWSPDGQRLASASLDGSARVWAASDGAPLRRFDGHGGHKLHAVAWSPDSVHVVSGGEDGSARMWAAGTGDEVGVFMHGETVRALAFSPDGHLLASGSFDDDAAHVWDVASTGLLRSFEHRGPVMGVAWSPSGTQLATASWDKSAKSWHVHASGVMRALQGHREGVYAVAVSADGSRVATGSGDDTARLWDASSGAVIAELRGHGLDLSAVNLSDTGAMLATASWDGTARLWDGHTGAFVRTLRGHAGRVLAVALSPDASRVATASEDQSVRVWNAATGEVQATLTHDGAVVDVTFSPDGDQLLSVSATHDARLWSSATGQALALGYEGPVTAAAFSPDGTRLALATRANTVQLWDPHTHASVTSFEGHTAAVSALAFSPDAKLLATASEDRSARVWDLATGALLASFSHRGPVLDVAFTPDGDRLLTAGSDAVAHEWTLAPAPWLAWGCTVLDSRAAHDNTTRAICARASATRAVELTPQPQPSIIAGDPPKYELLVEHGVEFVRVPGGTFTMGSAVGLDIEQPQQQVTLDSFYIARTELTNDQYARYLDANPDVVPPIGWQQERYNQRNQPVVALSWSDAKAYCDWAGFRLPTEAQWEYAARGGTTTEYWFGDEQGEVERFAWTMGNSGERPHAVATIGANAFGLHDTAGNVWEWTLDHSEYSAIPRSGDGLRDAPLVDGSWIVRGGSWPFLARHTRSAYRVRVGASVRFYDVGFRPVLPRREAAGR